MSIPVTEGPLVSVGIPTFNRPAGLRRTLACITRQTYGNLDIIVSDNASPTAATEGVVREFKDRDSRLRFFRQPENIGLDANFKFVLRQARGPYFFWAADDDEWTPDFVTACMAHAGQADLVMTNMRAAVRPRGLLRPKPPLDLSANHSPFANALAFLSNIQPSLFYGIFRTEALRPVLGERMFDYYDYYFILERILTGGVHVVPEVCFVIGVDSEGPALKPTQPRAGTVYTFGPFLRRSLDAVATSRSLNVLQRIRLLFLVCYVAANEFAFFERGARPGQARLMSGALAVLRPLSKLLRVPLPAHPAALPFPADPADVCAMFIPHEQLQSAEGVREHLRVSLGQLLEKDRVLQELEQEVARRRPGSIRRCCRAVRTLFGKDRGRPDLDWPRSMPPAGLTNLSELRRQLGTVLLQMETHEARIQAAVRELARRHPAHRSVPGGGPHGLSLRKLLRPLAAVFRRNRSA